MASTEDPPATAPASEGDGTTTKTGPNGEEITIQTETKTEGGKVVVTTTTTTKDPATGKKTIQKTTKTKTPKTSSSTSSTTCGPDDNGCKVYVCTIL